MTTFAKKSDIRVSGPGIVAVVGAGLIGCSWAIVFARAGWQVIVQDINLTTLKGAPDVLATQLKILEQRNLCADPQIILARITYKSDLNETVSEVDYVQ